MMIFYKKLLRFLKDETGDFGITLGLVTSVILIASVACGLYQVGKTQEQKTYAVRPEDSVVSPGDFAHTAVEVTEELVTASNEPLPGSTGWFKMNTKEVKITNPNEPGSGVIIKIRNDNNDERKDKDETVILPPDSPILSAAQESLVKGVEQDGSAGKRIKDDIAEAVSVTYKHWSNNVNETDEVIDTKAEEFLEKNYNNTAADVEKLIKEDLAVQNKLVNEQVAHNRKLLGMYRRDLAMDGQKFEYLESLQQQGYNLDAKIRSELDSLRERINDLKSKIAELEDEEKSLLAQVTGVTVTIEGDREIVHSLEVGTDEIICFFVASASPEGEYLFSWDYGDDREASSLIKSGEKWKDHHIYRSLTSDVTFKPVVKLYDSAGNLLASDSIVIKILLAEETPETFEERTDNIEVCGQWKESGSGGYGNTLTTYDISQLPVGTRFDIRFNAHSIPDQFVVDYEGVVVFDSGWRGDQGSYEEKPNLYPGGLSGPGQGNESAIFQKNRSDSFSVTVRGPEPGTAWDYALMANCSDSDY